MDTHGETAYASFGSLKLTFKTKSFKIENGVLNLNGIVPHFDFEAPILHNQEQTLLIRLVKRHILELLPALIFSRASSKANFFLLEKVYK